MDNVKVVAGADTLFADDAESGDAKWTYAAPWQRSTGMQCFSHNYYLQWRNVGPTGGYDSGLGDPRFRYGPPTPACWSGTTTTSTTTTRSTTT